MSLEMFANQMAEIDSLVPRQITKTRKVAQATFTRQVVTVVGVKTAAARFLPVSHEGHSNETYVDKVDVVDKQRAEFIARKLKGIERRAHMALFRELAAQVNDGDWKAFFTAKFDTPCIIPDGLCIACWNCALFGGLDARGQAATFSRARYFDTYSVEETLECTAMLESEEGMGIGNQVYEDMVADKEGKARGRGAETYHLYEYVKAGTHFPFITLIESPTLLDVAGYLHTVRRADAHGYGKYSANHGKFDTQFLAVATGYPRFSVLDMLRWADEGNGNLQSKLTNGEAQFDALGEAILLTGDQIEALAGKLQEAFDKYVVALG